LRLDGSDVECALDRGQIVALKRHVPICELKLELKAGSPPPLISLARKLNKAARLHVETQSKAARGYELAIQNPPTLPPAKFAELDEAMIAQSAFAAIARAWTGYVLACASYARHDDPEGIHELRVAIAFTTSVTHTRARGALREQTDPHQPPGRRCGCWPTSPFLFSGFRSGRIMELGRSGRTMMMSAAPGRAAAGERSELGGGRQSIAKFRSTDTAALTTVVAPYARARRAPTRRARSAWSADRPARAAWAALRLLTAVADSILRSLVGGERWRRRW
jgi:hypothetical protein